MSTIPEGAKTATAEGADVKTAVIAAAESLGLPANRVGYKVDLDHFRNASTGSSVPRTTVKVIVWQAEGGDEVAAEQEVAKPKKKRTPNPKPKAEAEAAPAEETEDKPKRERRPSRSEASDDEGTETEASAKAQAWFQTLLGYMDLVGTVNATGTDDRIRLRVKVDKAGRLIGRRGSTLGSIRLLLKELLRGEGDFIIDVDVDDDRPKSDRRSDDRRSDDRGERRGRSRDRGDRGDRRGRGRRDDKGKYPEDKLAAIARKAAAKAEETGKPITINLPLNSYDRRIVHLAISEIDGIQSESIVKDGTKYVQVAPELSVED